LKRIGERMETFSNAINELHSKGMFGGKVIMGDYLLEDVDRTKGLQSSPFGDFMWAGEIRITNRKNGTIVHVNNGTAHMAINHFVLEKGSQNPYQTSVESFLRDFMGSVQ